MGKDADTPHLFPFIGLNVVFSESAEVVKIVRKKITKSPVIAGVFVFLWLPLEMSELAACQLALSGGSVLHEALTADVG